MDDASARNRRLWRALERCVGLPRREREAFVEGLAASEPEVAAALERLLARDATGDGFLGEAVCELLIEPPPVVGPYRLGERLGEGGNGIVFRAERLEGQPSYPVAVKILWPSAENTETRSGPDELELSGTLEHPGICRMLGTGVTESGAPWFAMELVDGVPIDRHCVERRLPLSARLELFLEVLAAVEYAHSRQLLHCDLKPSNVLVDAHGRPRLLDFGIAGRLEAGRTPSAMAAFTPGYASPEQLRGEPLGPASDLFSLGALLYQLVCDRPPFAHRSRDPEESLRLLEAGPVPPSEVLARQPRGEGSLRARQVRGRLEAIIAKAMAARPEERYVNVSRLAEDLESFLHHRPVRAYRAGAFERLALGLRRHRVAWVAGLILLLVTVTVGWQALRLDAERRRAETEARRAESLSRLLLDSLGDLDPSTRVIGELDARELVERARARIERWDLDTAERTDLLLAIGSLFGGVGAYEPADEVLEEARRLRPEDPRVLESLAVAKVRVAAYDEAERLARRALASREAEGPAQARLGPLVTLAWTVLRNSRNEEPRLAEAERLATRALDLAVAHRASGLELGRVERLLASVLLQRGRPQQALEHARRAFERLERSRAPRYELALASNDVALAEQRTGRLAAATARFRTVASELEALLGTEHPEVAGALNNLGIVLAEAGRFSEAEAVFADALARYERLLGEDHPMTLNCASGAAQALQESGALERAEALHRRVALGLESALGAEHPFVPVAWAYLAENLALQGRTAEALRALAARRSEGEADDASWMSLVASSISSYVHGRERPSVEIEEELERTRRLLAQRYGPSSRLATEAGRRLERYRSRWGG